MMIRQVWLLLALASVPLSGCVAVTAVSGAAVERAISVFQDEEQSLPIDMQVAAVAVQKTLLQMHLQPRLIEFMDDGFMFAFANDKLDGWVRLIEQTQTLTTVAATVRKSMWSRETSVERAIFEAIEKASKQVQAGEQLDVRAYQKIYVKPNSEAAQVGWFLPGQKFQVSRASENGWLKITLPSGTYAFMQGDMLSFIHPQFLLVSSR